MKKTINVNKEHLNGIIKELDDKQWFCLGKTDASRTELFNFALALGVKEGYPTPLLANEGLIRSEYIENFMYIYQGLFYNQKIISNPDEIDHIADPDAVLNLAEEFANTGFYRLKELKEEFPDQEHFMAKLLNEISRIQIDDPSVCGSIE